MKLLKSLLVIGVISIITISCTKDQLEENETESQNSLESENLFNSQDLTLGVEIPNTRLSSNDLSVFQNINESLKGKGYRLSQVEFYTSIETATDVDAITVLPIPGASSTDYRTGFRFIPNDERRGTRDNLTYVTVSEFATSANGIAAEVPFDNMYDIWENETNCNNVSINKQAFDITTDGFPSSILSFAGDPQGPIADHNIIGFIPAFLFDAIGASAESTLAVNFTFDFVDENGESTDLNNDGKFDTSHTETWFNDSVVWSLDGSPGTVDINTVALHEFGHSVGHGHSGTLLASFDENGNFNGQLQFSPTNVMNASYIGIPDITLSGDDNSIYCENFSAWPWY